MKHFSVRFLSFLPVIHFIVSIVLVFGQYTKVLAFVKRFALIFGVVAKTNTDTIIIHWRVSLDFVMVFVLFCSGRTKTNSSGELRQFAVSIARKVPFPVISCNISR